LLFEFQIGVLFPYDPGLGEDDERTSLNMAPYVSEVTEDVRCPLDRCDVFIWFMKYSGCWS